MAVSKFEGNPLKMHQGVTKFYVAFMLLLSIMPGAHLNAQPPNLPQWLQQLKDDGPNQAWSRYWIYYKTDKMDSASRVAAAHALYQTAAAGNQRLQLLGKSARAKILFYAQPESKKAYAAQMRECLEQALLNDDPFLQAEFGRWYSEMLNSMNQKELAVQYASSTLRLMDYLGREHFPIVGVFYMWVGETLLIQEYYNESIGYLNKGLQYAAGDTLVKPFRFMFTYNNLGLAYRNLNQHDSAVYYFDKLYMYCRQINRPDWMEIAYKNRLISFVALGQLDSAKAVANRLLAIGKAQKGEPDDEMVASEMLGKIAMQEKRHAEALQHLLYAEKLNGNHYPKLMHRVRTNVATCYEALGQPGKALPYLKLVNAYNDSLRQARQQFAERYLRIKAEYDNEQNRQQSLAAEASQSIRLRNLGILLLLLFFGLAVFVLNRRRRRADFQRRAAAAELSLFKDEMVAKNQRIEELLESLQEQKVGQHDTRLAEELSRQMILTDADWNNFRYLFEKNHPGFFRRLQGKAPGITEAEQRMAALLKLHLSTKQIAAMQGISHDSVHKTRQRLRQRFGTDTTAELEAILAGV